MNLLAHLHLSEGRPVAVVAGNVLADFMRRVGATPLDDEFRVGLALHRMIDAFTDQHPLVRGLRDCFSPARRRLAGALTDVAFDYCLVQEWSQYSQVPLEDYVLARMEPVRTYLVERGSPLVVIADREQAGRWLLSYGTKDGLRKTFARMATRHHRAASALLGAEEEIVQHADSFRTAFRLFYPQVQGMAFGFGTAFAPAEATAGKP